MAMWRRPPRVEPPAVLFAFDPVDWPAGSYEPVPLQMLEGPGGEWEQAFRRSKAARRDRVAKHPNSSLGDRLDLLIGEPSLSNRSPSRGQNNTERNPS